jgi:hypothetical protein
MRDGDRRRGHTKADQKRFARVYAELLAVLERHMEG